MMDHTSFLSGTTLFSSLTDSELAIISHKLKETGIKRQQVLFKRNEDGNSLFLVKSGMIQHEVAEENALPVVVAVSRPGEFFGELSLLDGKGRSATARALEDSVLLELPRKDFLDLISKQSNICLHIMQVLAERLRLTTHNYCDTMDKLKRETSWKISPSHELCPELPLLSALQLQIGDLSENVSGLIGLQHLMGSTATLVEHLCKSSLKPGDVFLLGKPYSTSDEVLRHLLQKGFYVHPDSNHQDQMLPHDAGLHERIDDLLEVCRHWFRDKKSKENNRILLIDDGGHAIESLHEEKNRDLLPFFTCVEQTRSGIRRIEKLDLKVPVINVAETWVKLEYESPMIAESVKIELFQELVAIESGGIPIGRKALIIGYGSIGRWVAARLRGCGFQVSIYDKLPPLSQLARQDGFTLEQDYHKAIREAEIIIGCTGSPVMDQQEYSCLRDGALLVSTSSSDIEFKSWQLRQHAVSLGRPQSWKSGEFRLQENKFGEKLWEGTGHPCFDLYKVNLPQGKVYLVKGGFPVNFTGGIDSIPPYLIQLTRALLYAGAVQASQTGAPGLHSVQENFQELIISLYKQVSN